jgi:nucleoside-diphosphate-sugar epimerase
MADRKAINLIMDHAAEGEPVSPKQVADALLQALKNDAVTRFAEEVRSAIADSRKPYACDPSSRRTDVKTQRRRDLQAEIARLQDELREITAA